MSIKEQSKLLDKCIIGNAFFCYAYLIEICQGNKNLFEFYLKEAQRKGIDLKEIYVIDRNRLSLLIIQLTNILQTVESVIGKTNDIKLVLEFYEETKFRSHA